MTETKNLQFNFSARYYKIGNSIKAQKVWFVLHGYGQLAQYFVKKFSILGDQDICVIAPEGLSRFYVQRNPDRIGATWMTRENRLMDIENYLKYLQAVYDAEIQKRSDQEITLLGFSQGAATVSRWAQQGNIPFSKLILWAGLFPPDMHFDERKNVFADKKVFQVYGKNDPYLSDQVFTEMKDVNIKLDIQPEVIAFDGGHEIHDETLLKLI